MKTIGPESLMVTCDDVRVRIDGPKMWTLSRIEYKNSLLAVEDSAYGTVLNFTDIGFLGTGHKLDRPDGQEDVRLLEFYLDGKKISPQQDAVSGKSFKLVKKSRILNVFVENVTELTDNLIFETAVIRSKDETSLDVAYNFMHAWVSSATDVMARNFKGEELKAKFGDEAREEYSIKDLEWSAVYDSNSGKGSVSYVSASPEAGGADLLIVNAPKVYRKYYLMSFSHQKIPAEFNGTYKMVTGFFEASKDNWQTAALDLSQKLKKSKK